MTSQRSAPAAHDAVPGAAGAHRQAGVLVAGLALLAIAAVFALVMRADRAHPPVTGMDLGWLALVQGARSTPVTDAFKVLSLIGGPDGGTIIVAILAAGFLVVGRWRTACYLAVTEALGSACSQLIKHLVLRHRPPHPLVTADIGSFPSGHVITTVGVGMALTFVFARPGSRRWPLAAVAAAGLLMMFCRSYLGAHWLSDTIESLPVATGLGLVLWWAFGPLLAQDRDRPVRLPGWLPRPSAGRPVSGTGAGDPR
jgi:membrane-associated phospholipid phosphatase